MALLMTGTSITAIAGSKPGRDIDWHIFVVFLCPSDLILGQNLDWAVITFHILRAPGSNLDRHTGYRD
jgi:hypothetical protein